MGDARGRVREVRTDVPQGEGGEVLLYCGREAFGEGKGGGKGVRGDLSAKESEAEKERRKERGIEYKWKEGREDMIKDRPWK